MPAEEELDRLGVALDVAGAVAGDLLGVDVVGRLDVGPVLLRLLQKGGTVSEPGHARSPSSKPFQSLAGTVRLPARGSRLYSSEDRPRVDFDQNKRYKIS